MRPIDLDAVERAVAEAEKGTSAEVIVAINRQSGSYLDRELLVAASCAFAALLVMVYSARWEFRAYWIPPDAFVMGAAAFAALRLVPRWRRAWIGGARLDRQVRLHARNAFCVLSVSATRERTGLLVYVSRFEDRVLLLPDFGIEGKVEPARFQGILDRAGPLSRHADATVALVGLLDECGKVLAERLPPREESPDELPNRPRVEIG